jgi:hypothetical protein
VSASKTPRPCWRFRSPLQPPSSENRQICLNLTNSLFFRLFAGEKVGKPRACRILIAR